MSLEKCSSSKTSCLVLLGNDDESKIYVFFFKSLLQLKSAICLVLLGNDDDDYDIDWVIVEFDAKCVAAPEICFLAKLFQIFPPIKFERFSAERQTPNIQTSKESNKCTHVSYKDWC